MKDTRAKARTLRTLGLVLAGLSAVGALAGCSARPDEPVELLSILDSPEDPENDPMPDFGTGSVSLPDGGEIEVSRFVGETEAGRYWVASDWEQRLCAFAYQKDAKGLASTCSPMHRFEMSGLWISGMGSYDDEQGVQRTQRTEIFVAPDGYTPVEIPEGLEQIQPNVLAGDRTGEERPITFRSEKTGREIEFPG
ncbi:hypothetical protein [Glutamicibacter endophyticus]|uniref:hypothetical protein n=1 Tax=Glutamicibacter endophyticus TaxID=1522174 RepID=UPI003AF02395